MESPSSSSSSSSSTRSEQYRNWLELPRDVTASILQRLGAIEILESAQKVCMHWRNLCKDPSMWRAIDMRNHEYWDLDHLEKMCRHAIDRSSGQLRDISIEYFGTDDLLKHITHSSSQLRRLRLVSCYHIMDEGLNEAAAKLPLLEELEITICLFSKEPLMALGRCCPLLKSFKLNRQGIRSVHIECDEEAVAVAESMPELRHLQLFGNQLTNDGLNAILNGCPHLESLDLRRCFNVNLSGDLGKRCAERIKSLRRPDDPTDDYEFAAEIDDGGSFDEDDPSGMSDIDYVSLSEGYGHYEFSGESDLSYDDFSDYDFYDFGDYYFG
ncbi:F-box protein SKIP19-like [Quercus lobata]|uniref:F-box domain-containing protein n=1 Tax=Quercus lobata TaxID=97700 RepID=A0A7N2LRY3_QUELO|nr:F-box protein SKIP19-like [Quercus lobata]